MKTLLNDILAILLAVVFSTTIIDSQAAFMITRNSGDLYAAAVNAEAYTVLSQALGNSQPFYF